MIHADVTLLKIELMYMYLPDVVIVVGGEDRFGGVVRESVEAPATTGVTGGRIREEFARGERRTVDLDPELSRRSG